MKNIKENQRIWLEINSKIYVCVRVREREREITLIMDNKNKYATVK